MTAIALHSARQGRLRPSFFFCLLGCGFGLGLAAAALAQQPVYRCGQEYTNAPTDASRCERVAAQAVTVIAGTRVQAGSAGAVAAPAPAMSAASLAGPAQRQRDEQARSILLAELVQARQRHGQLVQALQQGEAARAGESPDSPGHQARVAALRAAAERAGRDVESLQRELARRPMVSTAP